MHKVVNYYQRDFIVRMDGLILKKTSFEIIKLARQKYVLEEGRIVMRV